MQHQRVLAIDGYCPCSTICNCHRVTLQVCKRAKREAMRFYLNTQIIIILNTKDVYMITFIYVVNIVQKFMYYVHGQNKDKPKVNTNTLKGKWKWHKTPTSYIMFYKSLNKEVKVWNNISCKTDGPLFYRAWVLHCIEWVPLCA